MITPIDIHQMRQIAYTVRAANYPVLDVKPIVFKTRWTPKNWPTGEYSYAVGNTIRFAKDFFWAETSWRVRHLCHELGHVWQSQKYGLARMAWRRIREAKAVEAEAERWADSAVQLWNKARKEVSR